MKAFIPFLLLLLFCLNFNLKAQNNNIQLGTMGFKGLGLSYERSWTPNFSTLFSYNNIHRTDEIADRYSNKIRAIHLEGRIYFGKKKPVLDGFYFAPHLTYKQNELRYYNINNPNSFGLTLANALVSVFTWGNASILEDEIQRADLAGKQNISSISIGFNWGYQKIIRHFSIDAGIKHNRNFIHSKYKGIPVDGGEYIPYKKDMNGFDLLLYLGVGYAF